MSARRRGLFALFASALALIVTAVANGLEGPAPALPAALAGAIDSYLLETMKRGQIPGASLVVIRDGQTVYRKAYGYSQLEPRTPTTETTWFTLGSTSKAFTGLAVLLCRQRGWLALDDPVDRHLPWLVLKYRGQPVPVKLADFLHHTSGIPETTLYTIPPGSGPQMLETGVRQLAGSELVAAPGTRFEYATVNYDILGLVVEKASGRSFQDFVTRELLAPLGLEHITVFEAQARRSGLAEGYKIEFLQPRRFTGPPFDGNLPAGYFMADIQGVGRWLLIHTGAAAVPDSFRSLITESVEPGPIPAGPGRYYAAGWYVLPAEGRIYHGGNNPDFSSFFTFYPGTGLGVGVLANVDSAFTQAAAEGVSALLAGREPASPDSDWLQFLDQAATAVTAVFTVLLAGVSAWLGRAVLAVPRRFAAAPGKWAVAGLGLAGLGVVAYVLGYFPELFLFDSNWFFMSVWGPVSLAVAAVLVFLTALGGWLLLLTRLFLSTGDKL